MKDPKTWLFALFAAFISIPFSLSSQHQLIIESFGFNPPQATLLACVTGIVGIMSTFTGVTIASRIPNSIAWVGIMCFVPSLLGVLLVNFLPWHGKVGLLFCLWIIGTHGVLRVNKGLSNPRNQPLTLLVLYWLCRGCRKRRPGIQRE